jgi:ribosomal protein L37AE/L43A
MPEVEKVVISRPAKPVRAKRRKLLQRKPELQISVYEEHRCPYCLDEVNRNDPRGVKECDVCHSLHHADCWEITGSCQVPHLNT